MRPSFWLRLTAVLGAAGTLVAVISGSASLGDGAPGARRAGAPTARCVVAAAWVEHRRLLYPSLAALVLFGLARSGHGAGAPSRAGRARVHGRSRVGRGDVQGRAVPPGLDSRLRHADETEDHVPAPPDRPLRDGRRGRGAARGLARRGDDGRPRARMRRGERAQPRAGRGHRPADGEAHALAPGGRRAGAGAVRTRVRARAVGALVRAARRRREHADRGARARREPLLRARLHALPEALDAAEHRHRRRGRSGAAARRLGGRDREPDAAGARRCSRSSSSGRRRTSGRSRC